MRSLLRSLLLFALLVFAPATRAADVRAASPMEAQGWLPDAPADWITVEGPALVAHGPARDARMLDKLSAHANESLPALAAALGVPVGTTIHVYLADTDERFRALQPGPVPSWADGTAWPGSATVFLHGPRARAGISRPLPQVLDHELVHVLLGRALAPRPVPTWLQEGTAQVLAHEVGPEIADRIARGMADGGLPTLDDLERGFPHDPGRADLAYALSASLIQQLQTRGGPDALPRLVHAVASGDSLRAAVQDVTGQPLTEIETTMRARWRAWLPAWLVGNRLAEYLFLGGAIALTVGGLQRMFGRGRRLADWREESAALRRIAWEIAGRRD